MVISESQNDRNPGQEGTQPIGHSQYWGVHHPQDIHSIVTQLRLKRGLLTLLFVVVNNSVL